MIIIIIIIIGISKAVLNRNTQFDSSSGPTEAVVVFLMAP